MLLRRRYSIDLQKAFADLAGDCNPMHVDPVAARRTLVGGLAVHGIHHVLSALEGFLAWSSKKGQPIAAIAGLKAQFLKPALVNDVIAFHLTKALPDGVQITGRIEAEAICRISIRFGPERIGETNPLPLLPPESVTEWSFDQLEGKAGSLPLGLDSALAAQLFPLATATLGPVGMAELLSLSRLVGMHCPGLHSIFGQLDVRFDGGGPAGRLDYRVETADPRFHRVALAVQGPRLQGEVAAFFRPPPEQQPEMNAVMRTVKPGIFAGKTALIVGGSRGLGEITAKIIAAGGGAPILTYHHGAAEAERIAADIRSHGGACELLRLDVRRCEPAIRRLFKGKKAPGSIYYFATPKIFGRQRGFLNQKLLEEFNGIYVKAFGLLIDAAAATAGKKLRVFYPSSVAVVEKLREMTEYAMSKRMAEELCAFYNEHSPHHEIVVERLPRIKTDQTSTLLAFPAENGLDIMAPIVTRMELPI